MVALPSWGEGGLSVGIKTDISAISDTGASVDCAGAEILRILGIKRRQLFQTNVMLRTTNGKGMTVLGVLPVEVETRSVDRETKVKAKTLLYVLRGTGLRLRQQDNTRKSWLYSTLLPTAVAQMKLYKGCKCQRHSHGHCGRG